MVLLFLGARNNFYANLSTEEILENMGKLKPQVCLRFLITHPVVTTVLPEILGFIVVIGYLNLP